MAAARVILVSDSHVSADAPQARANWDAVVSYVTAAAPDLVIHLGDLSLNRTNDAADLHYGRQQLDRLPVPWRAVPGSGLPAEAAQWSWLEGQAREHRGQPVALVTHKPVSAPGPELAEAPPYRFWPPSAYQRLTALFGDAPPALVLSGHVHQYRTLTLDRTDHLWVPTTWAVLPEKAQPVLGIKRCGIVSLTFDADPKPGPELIEPPGLGQFMITRDLPDPYHA